MKIKVLIENTADLPNFLTEHGLSLYIETSSHKILFDTGQSGAFCENAKRLGINLSEIDLAVISHAHYDHAGGLKTFLQINEKAPVYISRLAFEEHFNSAGKNIGIDPSLNESQRLVFTDDYLRLDDGIELFSCNDREFTYETTSFELKMRRNGEILPEDFRHEQYLLITDRGKSILFSGCSHKGILNIAEWLEPDILIGGFHFKTLDTQGGGALVLDTAATELARHKTVYYTCHCTGTEQYDYLKSRMKNRLHYLSAGQELEL